MIKIYSIRAKFNRDYHTKGAIFHLNHFHLKIVVLHLKVMTIQN